jgi:hypothetical protein
MARHHHNDYRDLSGRGGADPELARQVAVTGTRRGVVL